MHLNGVGQSRQPSDELPVLAYHFTGKPADAEDAPYTVSTELFEAEMKYLVEMGYPSTSLKALNAALVSGARWPKGGVVITFDDGRACIYKEAFPVLKKYKMTATVFLLSSRQNHPNFLSIDQIHEMEDHGIEFESHGHDHRGFATLSRDEIEYEVAYSKEQLDKVLGTPVSMFAFPYGQLNPVAEEVLRAAGYSGAVCSKTGCATPFVSPYQVPRLGMRSSDSLDRFVQKLQSGQKLALREKIMAKINKAFGRERT